MSYGPPPSHYPPQGGPGWQYGPPPDEPQATTAMVLGILGLAVCGLIAPFAWSIGRKSVRAIDESQGTLGGRGRAQAGYIMGVVGTILILVSVLGFVVVFAALFAASSSTSG